MDAWIATRSLSNLGTTGGAQRRPFFWAVNGWPHAGFASVNPQVLDSVAVFGYLPLRTSGSRDTLRERQNTRWRNSPATQTILAPPGANASSRTRWGAYGAPFRTMRNTESPSCSRASLKADNPGGRS